MPTIRLSPSRAYWQASPNDGQVCFRTAGGVHGGRIGSLRCAFFIRAAAALTLLPDSAGLAAFLGASLLLALSPGPDMLLVLHHALRQGARAGLLALAGIATGALFHLAAASFGTGLLIGRMPGGAEILRIGGGLFLLWLAFKAVRAGTPPLESDAAVASDGLAIYREGVLTNLLNPKVVLFLLAFLPPFVPDDSTEPAASAALLGLLFFLTGFAIMASLAQLAGKLRLLFVRHPGLFVWQARASAALFAVFGLALLI